MSKITNESVRAAADAMAEQDGRPGDGRFYLDFAFQVLVDQEDYDRVEIDEGLLVKFGTDDEGDDHWCAAGSAGQHHVGSSCGCNPVPINGSGRTGWSWSHGPPLHDGERYGCD